MFQFIENGWLSATIGFTKGKPSILRIEGPQINETSPKKTTQKHFQTWLTRNLKKRSNNYHKRSPKSRKDTKNNDIKSTRKVDGKMELGSAMEGGRVREDSGGPWAQYMYRLAWTCQLNWQIESGIDRNVAAISLPDWKFSWLSNRIK